MLRARPPAPRRDCTVARVRSETWAALAGVARRGRTGERRTLADQKLTFIFCLIDEDTRAPCEPRILFSQVSGMDSRLEAIVDALAGVSLYLLYG